MTKLVSRTMIIESADLKDKGPGFVDAYAELHVSKGILFDNIPMSLSGIEVDAEGAAVAHDQRKALEYINQLAGAPPKPVNVDGRLFVFYMVPFIQ